jgi:hypothetical protein
VKAMLSFEEILSISRTKAISFPDAFVERQSLEYGKETFRQDSFGHLR